VAKFTRKLSTTFLIIAAIFTFISLSHAQEYTYGVKIEQRALDLLTLVSQRMSNVLEASSLEEAISMKARIVPGDLFEPGQAIGPLSSEVIEQLPEMIIQTQIELFRSDPSQVRVNLTSNLADLQFLVSGSEALAVLPQEGVFSQMNIPQMLPQQLILQDDGGLFTLINLIGGIPFGSVLGQEAGEGGTGGTDITYGEVGPEQQRATIRYWGKDKVEAGIVHSVNILTSGPAPYSQSIRIWVLEDTLDLYQISIEDERGTQIFIVFDKI